MTQIHVVEFKHDENDEDVVWSQGFLTAKHATVIHNGIAMLCIDAGYGYGLDVRKVDVPDGLTSSPAEGKRVILKIDEFETTSIDEFEAEFRRQILEG